MNKFYLYTNFLSPGGLQRVIFDYVGIVLQVINPVASDPIATDPIAIGSITFADSFISSSFAALK